MKRPVRALRWACGMVLASLLASPVSQALSPSDSAALVTAYFRLLLAQQVPAQAKSMAEDAEPADRSQIEAAATRWTGSRVGEIRKSLEKRLGAAAKTAFQEFVARFTAAESKKDLAYLGQVASGLPLKTAPRSYAELRQALVESLLKSDVDAGSAFLGEIQTWSDLRDSKPDRTPPLNAWLARSGSGAPSAAGPSTAPAGTSAKAAEPSDPLAEAEAGFAEDAEILDTSGSNPLDTFAGLEKAKRDKQLQEAQAGMQQVAAERKAAEEEYASKKMASAQAEAEAMKHQAEQLAAVEQQALEQRQRSWGNRLKSLVATTLGAAGGAFLGEIGTRAGEQAANEVFK